MFIYTLIVLTLAIAVLVWLAIGVSFASSRDLNRLRGIELLAPGEADGSYECVLTS